MANKPKIDCKIQHSITTYFSLAGLLYMKMLQRAEILLLTILPSGVASPTVQVRRSINLMVKFTMYGMQAIRPAVFIAPTTIAEAIIAPVKYVPLFPMKVFAG